MKDNKLEDCVFVMPFNKMFLKPYKCMRYDDCEHQYMIGSTRLCVKYGFDIEIKDSPTWEECEVRAMKR